MFESTILKVHDSYRILFSMKVILISAVFLFVSEDNELVRIILVKSGRDAANCWHSLLTNEYSADPWTFNEMEKKLTLERFQKEVHLAECIVMTERKADAFTVITAKSDHLSLFLIV